MPPETTPMQPLAAASIPTPPKPSIAHSFLPSTVALTKAIGIAESGGKYSASDNTGDNANSHGAYQMTPGFLQQWAPKAGVQYQQGMKLTPQQQDEVAGNAVQTMMTTGDPNHPHLGKLTPAQVVSTWNTGNPDAYLDPEYGKNNTYGSTANYVDKVSQLYNKEAAKNPKPITGDSGVGQTANISNNNEAAPDWKMALEGLGLGGLGWVIGQGASALRDSLPTVGALVGSRFGPAGSVIGSQAGQGLESLFGGGSNNGGGQPPTGSGNMTTQPQEGNNEDFSQQVQQSSLSSKLVQDAINESLGGTVANRTFSQSSNGKAAVNTAAMFGLIKPDENGNLMYDEGKSKQVEGELGNALDKQIEAQDKKTSVASVLNYGGQYISNDRFSTAADRQDASKRMQEEVAARGVGNNGDMSLSDMRQAQKEHYQAAKNGYRGGRTSAQILAHKALGDAFGRVIRDNLPDAELYDRTKKMQHDLINAREVGKRLQGRRAPTHVHPIWEAVLRRAALAAETYVGDIVGGPLGGVVGAVAGDYMNGKLNKHFKQNIFESKGMKAAMDVLEDTKPKEYQKIIDSLKKRGVKIPRDPDRVPGSTMGKVKDVSKDLEQFKQGKGLVPPNVDTEINPKSPRGENVNANIDYQGDADLHPDKNSAFSSEMMQNTFKRLSDWYEQTGDAENFGALKKVEKKWHQGNISRDELESINQEYQKMSLSNFSANNNNALRGLTLGKQLPPKPLGEYMGGNETQEASSQQNPHTEQPGMVSNPHSPLASFPPKPVDTEVNPQSPRGETVQANVDFNKNDQIIIPRASRQTDLQREIMNNTFQKLKDWYKKTGNSSDADAVGKLEEHWQTTGISVREADSLQKEYEKMTSGEGLKMKNAIGENIKKNPSLFIGREATPKQMAELGVNSDYAGNRAYSREQGPLHHRSSSFPEFKKSKEEEGLISPTKAMNLPGKIKIRLASVKNGLIDIIDKQDSPTASVSELIWSIPDDDRLKAIDEMTRDGKSLIDATERITTTGLLKSMREKGFDPSQPIEVRKKPDGSYEVMDGLNRLAVARALGLKNIPIKVVP